VIGHIEQAVGESSNDCVHAIEAARGGIHRSNLIPSGSWAKKTANIEEIPLQSRRVPIFTLGLRPR
jgi:hypothetical protein